MRIKFSSHSLKRIKEREITKEDIINAIRFPDKVESSKIEKIDFW